MAALQDRLSVLALYQRLHRLPGGKRLFTGIFQRIAPYFRTIPVRVDSVDVGEVVVSMRDTRGVRNHLGTVHAIALCNLAELAMGVAAEATLPKTHRWIPKGMTVQYLAKARGTMHATAVLSLPEPLPDGDTLHVDIAVRDDRGEMVFHADIAIWVTRRSS